MDALVRLGQAATGLLAQAAGVAAAVVITWRLLLLILSGGSERALGQFLRMVLVFGIAAAIMTHLPEAWEVVTVLGGAIVGTVLDAVRSEV
jgi:hypothetical protein